MTDTTTAPRPDERIKKVSRWRRAMIHPELGGICGTVLTGCSLPMPKAHSFGCSWA
ncbi:MAG: hypothetical protein WAT09_08640 [Paracoccaceae bacterium]